MDRNNRLLNPAAGNFRPGGRNLTHQQKNNMPPKVIPPPSTYLETRVLNLEEEHASLRGEVSTLKEKYHQLCRSIEKTKEAGDARVQPLPDAELDRSHKTALELGQELEKLTVKTRSLTNNEPKQEPAESQSPKVSHSTPSDLKAASVASNNFQAKLIPPHLRESSKAANGDAHNTTASYPVGPTKDLYEPLKTDGPVDTVVAKHFGPTPLTPPLSPTLDGKTENIIKHVDAVTTEEWKPHYLTTLPKLPKDILSKIPPQQSMITFSSDFLSNTLGGGMWSPGLRFVTPSGPCILKNRTYYTLDATNEPYLPKTAGEHGAKLTAFFNKSPEEDYPELQIKSYEDVPVFVERKDTNGRIRYAYFGNYSQTRWSDKLDNDTMRTRVSQHVKEHWARELTATPREEWVTEALKKHFFPKPEYSGRLYAPPNEEDYESVNSEDERKKREKMTRDIEHYVEELRDWEREASMKTAMVKEQFILDAFNAADADDPPALRLWWEYLECVDWRKDFYDMLVTLQSRDQQYL